VGNSNDSNLSTYSINASTGALTQVGGVVATGAVSSVIVEPSGRVAYVTNINGGVSAFSIDASTGALNSIGSLAAGALPFSVAADLSGRFVYVVNDGDDTLSTFTINASTGALTSVGATVATGHQPVSITTTGVIR